MQVITLRNAFKYLYYNRCVLYILFTLFRFVINRIRFGNCWMTHHSSNKAVFRSRDIYRYLLIFKLNCFCRL